MLLGTIRQRRSVPFLTLVIWIFTVSPVGADSPTDPYESDPLRLIAFRDQDQPVGATVVNVWICGRPEDDNVIEIDEAIRVLETEHVPLLSWLSDGRYHLDIKARSRNERCHRLGGQGSGFCWGRSGGG